MYSIIYTWLSIATWILTSLAAPIPLPNITPNIISRGAIKPVLTGSPVAFGSGTYPRATRLHDNTILGVYTAFQNGNNVLLTVTSTDNGSSWGPLGEITRGPSNANDIDNPFVLQLPAPSKRIICAFRNHSKNPSTRAYTYFRITITYSDDGGKSWVFLSEPTANAGPVQGSWEPFLRNAVDGSLQLYYSHENSAQDQDTLQRISHDGGATWSAATCVSGAGITSRDGMTSVAALSSPTSLILVYETETTGLFFLGAVFSADDGKTWGGRTTIYTPSSPNTSAGAPQVVNVGGTLVVSFMTNEDQQLSAPSNSYTDHTSVKVITSGDLGKTFGNKVTVGAPQSVWPGLMDLGAGGKFLYLLDKAGAKAQLITLS
ncbi:MAG: hypothetical protein LQ338_004086 [Usnochroma carphineum]|nr:MAG: hypothetical protein LQ338_004086 [Usnochroma carphineum]